MVFLTLLGLPLDDLDFLIWFKNGIIRPTDDDHRVEANTKMIEYLYAELDRRAARRRSRATTSSAVSSPPRSTARPSHAKT